MRAIFIIEVSKRPSYRLKNFKIERVNGKLFWTSNSLSLQITAKTYDEAVAIAKRYAIKTDSLFVDRGGAIARENFDPHGLPFLDGDLSGSEEPPSKSPQQIDAP